MFEILVGTLYYTLMIGLFIGPIVLFIIRLITVILDKNSLKESLFILLIPCSIGYYLKGKNRFSLLYDGLLIFFFVCTFLGSLFMIYQSIM